MAEAGKRKREGLYSSEFAALFGISRDTLLYYDRIGLFQPQLRAENGYRLYSLDQVHQFDLLRMLRSANLPLEEIDRCLRHQQPEELLSLLQTQTQLLSEQIANLQQIQQRLRNTISSIEHGLHVECGVPRVEERDPVRFLVLEATPEMLADRYLRMSQIRKNLLNREKRASFEDFLRNGIVRKEHLLEDRFDKDYFCCRTSSHSSGPDILEQPGGTYAVVEHKGPYETLDESYRQLKAYIARQGWRIRGNAYETELLGYTVFSDSRDYVIQIAIPIDTAGGETN